MTRRADRRRRHARLRRHGRRAVVASLSGALLVLAASPAGTFAPFAIGQQSGDDSDEADQGDGEDVPPTAPVASPTPAPITSACPPDAPSIGFYDVPPGSTHAPAIDCLALWGISSGRAGHVYQPDAPVLLGHFASLLRRTLEPAGASLDTVTPVTGQPPSRENAVRRLAAAGILPVDGDDADAEAPLRRDTTAVALAKAYALATGEALPTADWQDLADLADHPESDTITAAVSLGLIRGAGDDRFDPAGTVTRGQLASLLTRLLAELVDAALATPPASPDWGPEIEYAISVGEAVDQTRIPELLDPPLEHAETTLTRLYPDGCVTETTTSPACVYGDADAGRTLVMYGDSHMAHWFPAINTLAARHSWKVVVLTKGGCPAWDVEVRDHLGNPAPCAQWRQHALQRIADLQPQMVLVSGASHYEAYDEQGRPDSSRRAANLIAGQAEALDDIEAAVPEARLVVFGTSGRLPFDAVDCLRANDGDVAACTAPRHEVIDDDLVDAQRELAEQHDAAFADTSRWLCTANACPPVIEGRLVRWDAHHLSPGVTGWLGPMIEPIVFGEPG